MKMDSTFLAFLIVFPYVKVLLNISYIYIHMCDILNMIYEITNEFWIIWLTHFVYGVYIGAITFPPFYFLYLWYCSTK